LENSSCVLLHVIPNLYSKGGTPRKLLNLVRAKESNRLRHVFLVFGNLRDNLNREMLQARAIVVEVTRRRNYDLRLLLDIIRFVHIYHADIISTHFARADVYGALAGILTSKPVIKNVHGILWNNSRFLQKVDGFLSRFRACTVCNSKATREAVIRQTGAMNAIVINNGVPNRAVTLTAEQRASMRSTLAIPHDAYVIGHVGGMIPLRDQNVILSVVEQIVREGINVYLVLVGDGPLRNELESKCSRLGIMRRVHFLGYRDDVPELLAAFDVYVNMAREEGFGIAVVEAMQAGLPVVLANAGALPELIEDGISGILVPPGDADSLANVINNLANDGELRNKLGEEARRRARSQFSISRYVKDMEQLYIEFGSGDAPK
jgi:glycosyltransferase involved in cell wall biosynthesis